MNRRQFISLGTTGTIASIITGGASAKTGAAPASSLFEDMKEAVAVFESTSMFDYEKRKDALDKAQRVIYAMEKGVHYSRHLARGASMPQEDVEKAHAAFPVLWWYDRAFEKVLSEFISTEVKGDKPAIWYIYNMGVVVKTRSVSFSIDLSHRLGAKFAPYLDFALVTHNHGDHYSGEFINAMVRNRKKIISNFILLPGWYFKGDRKTYTFGDVKVHVSEADHNKGLPKAVMCFEVECGGEKPFVIFHSGDTHREHFFAPYTKSPDIFMGHCAIGLNLVNAYKTTMPAKLMLPLHHQELGHLGGKYRCVAFNEEPASYMKKLTDAGAHTAMPVWGDRIA